MFPPIGGSGRASAKQIPAGALGAGTIDPLRAALLGGPAPTLSRDACFYLSNMSVQFADGEIVQLQPAPGGSETDDLDEVLKIIDDNHAYFRDLVKQSFARRKRS